MRHGCWRFRRRASVCAALASPALKHAHMQVEPPSQPRRLTAPIAPLGNLCLQIPTASGTVLLKWSSRSCLTHTIGSSIASALTPRRSLGNGSHQWHSVTLASSLVQLEQPFQNLKENRRLRGCSNLKLRPGCFCTAGAGCMLRMLIVVPFFASNVYSPCNVSPSSAKPCFARHCREAAVGHR